MAPLLLALGVFLFGAGVVAALALGLMRMPAVLERRRIDRRMADVTKPLQVDHGGEDHALVKERIEGALPALDRVASQTKYGS